MLKPAVKLLKILLKGELPELIHRRREAVREKDIEAELLKKCDLTDSDREVIESQICEFNIQPLVSIIMPVFDVDEQWLRLCIESVISQIYPNWELCIADDFSRKTHVRSVLEEYRVADSRIKVIFRDKNGHISQASNSALSLATGEFVALLDNDDELTENALFEVVSLINAHRDVDLIYSDEDKIDENNRRFDMTCKPDWNEDLFYSMNYLNHLTVYRRRILNEIGGWRIGFEGSQDYDLALRYIEQIPTGNIKHIPKILYHWRAISGSVALNPGQKNYAHQRARLAISEHFERMSIPVIVSAGFANYHRINPVFAIQPTVKLIHLDQAFEDSENSTEDVLIFAKKGIRVVKDDSFAELAGQAMRPDIGAVGGVILANNRQIDNCGFINGIPINRGKDRNYVGKLASGRVLQSVDEVNDVLAIRRELWSGYETKNLTTITALCLNLRKDGLRILFTPQAMFAKN